MVWPSRMFSLALQLDSTSSNFQIFTPASFIDFVSSLYYHHNMSRTIAGDICTHWHPLVAMTKFDCQNLYSFRQQSFIFIHRHWHRDTAKDKKSKMTIQWLAWWHRSSLTTNTASVIDTVSLKDDMHMLEIQ